MPIHRLDKQPKRHAVLSDMTCDSDGKIDRFISRRDVKRTLLLHEFDNSPYFVGTFLVGAYQEILGDLHNLFGDTNAVHVDISATGEVALDTILKGQTISEVLDHVQINGRDLMHRLQISVETAVRTGRIDNTQAAEFVGCYENALNGYTYLEPPAVN
jgi:arginine decarboxylase